MRKRECTPVRALRSSAPTEMEQRHVFACPACRAQVRLSSAWKGLRRPSELELLRPADEAFVSRVLDALRQDRRRRTRNRARIAAAASLLFFFSVGAARERSTSAAVGAEEAYSQLVAPPVLNDLLPIGVD